MMLQHQPRHRDDRTPRRGGKPVLRRQARRAERRQWMADAIAEAGAL